MVNDPSRVTARGDGLGLVKCNQPTSFTVSAQGATTKDLDVLILGDNIFNLIKCSLLKL